VFFNAYKKLPAIFGTDNMVENLQASLLKLKG
jgi:hypothetical protein